MRAYAFTHTVFGHPNLTRSSVWVARPTSLHDREDRALVIVKRLLQGRRQDTQTFKHKVTTRSSSDPFRPLTRTTLALSATPTYTVPGARCVRTYVRRDIATGSVRTFSVRAVCAEEVDTTGSHCGWRSFPGWPLDVARERPRHVASAKHIARSVCDHA